MVIITTGAAVINFVDGEVPSGTINGINSIFNLNFIPISGSLKLYLNGVRLKNTVDYSYSGNTITMTTIPFTNDLLLSDYRH